MSKEKTGGNSGAHREKLFCYYSAHLCNAREAAIKAGYPAKTADQTAAELLMRPSIRRKIAELLKENEEMWLRGMAVQGLLRLAFGSVNDAAALVWGDVAEQSVEGLDLYHVAEMRRPKGGGCELRFFNRLDALRLLLEYAGKSEAPYGRQSSFYQALEQAAKAVSGGDTDAV